MTLPAEVEQPQYPVLDPYSGGVDDDVANDYHLYNANSGATDCNNIDEYLPEHSTLSKCFFFPHCRQPDSCPYFHPVSVCRLAGGFWDMVQQQAFQYAYTSVDTSSIDFIWRIKTTCTFTSLPPVYSYSPALFNYVYI